MSDQNVEHWMSELAAEINRTPYRNPQQFAGVVERSARAILTRVLAAALPAPAAPPPWHPMETAKQENGNGPILVMARRVASDEPSRMWAYWNHREGWWYRFGASQPTRIYPTVWFDIDSIPQGPLK